MPEAAFARIDDSWQKLAALARPAERCTCLPISAENGDNVRERSATMPGTRAPRWSELLDGVEPEGGAPARPAVAPGRSGLREPGRAGAASRGRSSSGRLRTGDAVRVQPSGQLSRVSRIAAGASRSSGGVGGRHGHDRARRGARCNRRVAGRSHRHRRRARRDRRPVRGDDHLADSTHRCCRAAATSCDRRAAGRPRPINPLKYKIHLSTLGSHCRDHPRALRRSASAGC